MSNFQKIRDAHPHLANDEALREQALELDVLQAFAVQMNSGEGKQYIKTKEKQASRLIQQVLNENKGEGVQVATVARLEAILELIAELKGVQDDTKSMQQVIDEIVRTG